jgi:hypothetical protein
MAACARVDAVASTYPMIPDFDDLIALWTRPLPAGDEALAAFARLYTDPVMVNGASMSLAALVDRARATQSTFSELEARLLARSDTPTHSTIVFRMRGKHVGPWLTPLGEIAPTGNVVERQVIDLLRLENGRISEVWMVSDELGALNAIGALTRAS